MYRRSTDSWYYYPNEDFSKNFYFVNRSVRPACIFFLYDTFSKSHIIELELEIKNGNNV